MSTLSVDAMNMKHDPPRHAAGPARILRALIRLGLDREAIPAAVRLIREFEEMAAEEREREVAA